MNGNAMLRPALWGALVIGVLSGLPVVNLGNCCCCAWIIGGGMLAAYLLQSGTDTPITLGDGALVGLLAGLFGAVVNLVVAVPMRLLLGPTQQRLVQRILESQQDVPDNVRQMIDNMDATGIGVAALLVGFVVMLVMGAVFSGLGGLLGAFFFKKKTAPVAGNS
ncbi:MAG: hypothetical protein NTY02_08350 [Acidobacteria bacterium]|nr:hypothetical protein [Acidobacteriota bacterium]